jgi:subtilisin-like proprotein convertase family protein/subtilisin family serine protease
MMIKKQYQLIFCLIIVWLPINCVWATTRSAETQIPTNQWAVKLLPGEDPDLVAQSIGAINTGAVASLKDTYVFLIPDSSTLTQSTRKRVKENSKVIWMQQQVKRWRFLRTQYFTDPLYPDQWHLSNTGQNGGTVDEDVHILPVWNEGLSGEGIVIGIVDDGLQHDHPDLSANYLSALSYDFNNNDSNPYPYLGDWYGGDGHGTSVAGVAAARENNGTCGVGAAYRASLAGIRLLASEVSDADEANALSYKRDQIDIYSNSWGPSDGNGPEAPGPLTVEALESNVHYGRNGLGNIYVFAAGNGLQYNDNVNMDGYANLRFVIAVSAINLYGTQSYYSEPGACILVCAPSDGRVSGIYTTDLMGRYGDDSGDCTGSFGGTSSAAPLVSGIIALILDENPGLSWRDVQHILVKSAQQNDPDDIDWQVNGAGLKINHKYGFGRIHASNAVRLARHWQSVSQEKTVESQDLVMNLTIPEKPAAPLKSNISIQANLSVEHIAVILTTNHTCSEQLNINLISPSGTSSTLIAPHSSRTSYNEWQFTSVRYWGETSDGQWTLEVQDTSYSCSGTLKQWQLIVYGEDQNQKVNQLPIADTDYIKTIKNQSVQIAPLLNDFDADRDPLQIVNITQPVNGKIVAYDNSHFTYVPNSDFIGREELTYTISDQQTNNTGIIIIDILDYTTVANNESQAITDADPRGIVSEINVLSGGQLKGIDVNLQFSHNNISDLSAYLISPDMDRILLFSNLNTTQSNLNIHLSSASALSIDNGDSNYSETYLPSETFRAIENIYAVGKWQLLIVDNTSGYSGTLDNWQLQLTFDAIGNTANPVARSDQFHTYPNMRVCMNVLNNDSDPNGQKLIIGSIEQPNHGHATIDNCGIIYQPESNFSGVDNLRYYAMNESGQKSSADVDIIVASDLALSFDGINDCISCGKPAVLNILNQLTIELWIHPKNYGELNVQGFGRLLDKERYILFLNESGRDDYADHSLMFAIEHPSGVMVMGNTPKNSIQLNEWQHIAASYNSQTNAMNIYINGQKQVLSYPFQRPYGSIVSSQSDTLYIGESNNMDRAFCGMMDEICIWNIIRSADDIMSDMNQSFSTPPKGLVAYWPMRPITSYLKDMTTNGIHCMIQSPKWVPGVHQYNMPTIWSEKDIIYTKMDTPITFKPLENDGLIASPETIQVSSCQTRGMGQLLVLSDFSITYIPDTAFLGSDLYAYTITTNDGYFTSALIQVNVVSDFSLYYKKRSEYVYATNSNKWMLDGPMTFTAWIKPEDTSAPDDMREDYIVDKKVFSIFINHMNSTKYFDNSLVYWREKLDGTWYAASTPDYSIEWKKWQHIGVVDNNNGQVSIYINGEPFKLLENGTYSSKRASHTLHALILGNASDLQHAFQGNMDEIYIWSEALTQEQIQQSMHSCFPGQSETLLAYWPMTDSGNKILDYSRNGLHGTLYDVLFKEGALPRNPASVSNIISGLGQINGIEKAPVCVDDLKGDLVLGMEEILFMINYLGSFEK